MQAKVVLYRFLTNHCEWCVDVYSLLDEVSGTERAPLLAQLTQYMSQANLSSPGWVGYEVFPNENASDPILRLFESSCTACKQALATAKHNQDEIGKSRPAIHFGSVLVGLAICHEEKHRNNKLALDSRSLTDFREETRSSKKLIENLTAAVTLWRAERPREAILRELQDNDVIRRWGPEDKEFFTFFKELTAELQKNPTK
jgi:hypothetical protein